MRDFGLLRSQDIATKIAKGKIVGATEQPRVAFDLGQDLGLRLRT